MTKSKYRTHNLLEKEVLPWPAYIPNEATKLILGTFPTKESNRDFNFFYPNKNNKFWKVLSAISELKLTEYNEGIEWKETAIIERKQVLNKLKLGITDIGYTILRHNNSSLDSNLLPVEFSDIFSIVNCCPTIGTVILTSRSKGNSVLSWFSIYCSLNGIELNFDMKNKKAPYETKIILNDRILKIIIVDSPSGAAGNKEEFLINQYRSVLMDF